MIYLANAFSLNMLGEGYQGTLAVTPLSVRQAAAILSTIQTYNKSRFLNAVGHTCTGKIIKDLLQNELPTLALPDGERFTVRLRPDDTLIVAQYFGPRLSEGTVALPPNARIAWSLVTPEQTREGGATPETTP
jgi:hypothetical protein